MQTLVIDPINSQTLYAAFSGGHFYKRTLEKGWIKIGLSDYDVLALAIDPVTPQTLYAATDGGGVYKSLNGGDTWTTINLGLTSSHVNALAIDPTPSSTLYAGTQSGGVFKSINGGGSWNSVNVGLTDTLITALLIDPKNPSVLYAGVTAGTVYKSVNRGTDWSAMKIDSINTSITALALDPQRTEILYVSTRESGLWRYCGCNSPLKPTLISPSGNTSAAPKFSWNAVEGAEWYQLWVNDAAAEGKIQQWYTAAQTACPAGTGACSVVPATLLAPGNGTWWVRAWNSCNGGSNGPWSDGMKITIPSAGIPGKATLLAPSGTVTTTTPAYAWNAVPNSSWYQLWVSDLSGTPKIQTWYSAAQAQCASATGICAVTPTAPLTSGFYQWFIQTWNDAGYGPWCDGMSFTVSAIDSGLAEITSPAPSSTLTSTVLPFIWTAGTGISQYWLYIGKTVGAIDIYSEDQKTNLSALVQKLPNDGSTISARLWSFKNSDWKYNDYTYKTCTGCGSILAAINSPAPGSMLTSTTVTFNWSAGTSVSQFWLSIGKSSGSSEIYNNEQGISLFATVSKLPNDGSTIYVRLWSKILGYWAFNEYTFVSVSGGGSSRAAVLQQGGGVAKSRNPATRFRGKMQS